MVDSPGYDKVLKKVSIRFAEMPLHKFNSLYVLYMLQNMTDFDLIRQHCCTVTCIHALFSGGRLVRHPR